MGAHGEGGVPVFLAAHAAHVRVWVERDVAGGEDAELVALEALTQGLPEDLRRAVAEATRRVGQALLEIDAEAADDAAPAVGPFLGLALHRVRQQARHGRGLASCT